MAMIVLGKTKCPICGRVVDKGEPLVGFPAFLPRGHALAAFSDSVCHRACVEDHPRGQEVLHLRDAFEKVLRRVPRRRPRVEGEAWLAGAVEKLWQEPGFKVAPAPIIIVDAHTKLLDEGAAAGNGENFERTGLTAKLVAEIALSQEFRPRVTRSPFIVEALLGGDGSRSWSMQCEPWTAPDCHGRILAWVSFLSPDAPFAELPLGETFSLTLGGEELGEATLRVFPRFSTDYEENDFVTDPGAPVRSAA